MKMVYTSILRHATLLVGKAAVLEGKEHIKHCLLLNKLPLRGGDSLHKRPGEKITSFLGRKIKPADINFGYREAMELG